ncbi:MAG: leucine-rich repeat domain-containing protein [Holosporaceae bacterium]|nr:leucine-rich repeat domain-containing protein [Holosporaceae bacterium]
MWGEGGLQQQEAEITDNELRKLFGEDINIIRSYNSGKIIGALQEGKKNRSCFERDGITSRRDIEKIRSSIDFLFIPKGIYSISRNFGCKKLRSVVFEDGSRVRELGGFEGCTQLESIIIPKSVRLISMYAFSGCINLESVVFGANSQLVGIDGNAFKGCKSLKSVNIPRNVKKN